MRKRILFYLVLLAGTRLSALNTGTSFRHLTTADGLSDNTVMSVLQDRFGLMWFGTEFGLNQFDGYSVKTYHHDPSDSTSLSDDHINTLIEGPDGSLWIGTASGGINQFLRHQRVFKRYQRQDDDPTSLLDNSVKILYRDRRGAVWAGTASGLSLYVRETDSFLHYLSGCYVKAVCEDSQGRLWVGTGYDGLFRFDAAENRFIQYGHDPTDPHSISTNSIESIAEDSLQNLWIGTLDGGLNWFDEEKQQFIRYRNPSDDGKGNNTVFSLHCDRSGSLWAGTENGGLHRMSIRKIRGSDAPGVGFQIYMNDKNDAGSLNNNTVLSIYEDGQGNLWAGTFCGGVNLLRVDKKPFENHRVEPFNDHGLSHNIVQCFHEDRAGNLWIGTDGGGLNYFDRSAGRFTHYTHNPGDPNGISNDHVLDLCEDHSGHLWIATWDGLNHFDRSGRRFMHYRHVDYSSDPAGLGSNKITCVHEDIRKNLWVGTISGLHVLDPKRGRFFRAFEGDGSTLRNGYIQCLYQDRAGNLWVGTVWGFYFLSREDILAGRFEFIHYVNEGPNAANLSENHIFSILEDSRGRVWFATLNGLNCFLRETRSFITYTVKDGLASNRIASIMEDEKGFIWVGTNKGISKLDPSSHRAVSFDARDGLVGDDFTRGVIRTRSNELAFGGKSGFTLFSPDSIQTCSYVPPVVLTDFQIFNRSVPLHSIRRKRVADLWPDSLAIELSHRQNIFSFEFSALDFTAPEKNQYRYMLEGFDREWRQTDAYRRFVTYTNLSAGDYVFRVQGSNSDGIWNEKGLSLGLKIHPPLWRTRWALFFYAAVLVSILCLLRQLILYREKIKTEILLERQEAKRIHELDEMKLRFFTNVSHEFRTPVTLIIGLLERLMRSKGSFHKKDMAGNYQIMLRNARRLLRLINQIMDIRKLESGGLRLELKKHDIIHFLRTIFASFVHQAEQRSIRYHFSANPEKLSVWFDPDKVDKIMYNMLSNAFKFTRDQGEIRVAVAIAPGNGSDENPPDAGPDSDGNHRFLEIRIQDNGIGIPGEHLEKIFDPFVQVECDEGKTSIGTGVGLALTRELITLHQGSIDVTSRFGSGACFQIRLPLFLTPGSPDVSPEDPVSDEFDPVCRESESVISDVKVPDESAPLILIVDDDRDFLTYLKEELNPDYRVIEATDGKSAAAMALEFIPDLIIADIRMPKMDGFSLCAAIKKDIKTSHIPFILLTSRTNEQSRINGFDLGADEYIEKPFDSHYLHTRITNLLKSRKQLRERYSHEVYLQPQNIVITSEDERFLNHVIQSIDKHIEDSDFSVSDLGHEIGFSRVQLYRKIKALTDLTPNDLIKTLRLKRSAQLLEKSHLTVFEIAYRVGFKDPSYFCKCFRSHYGVSPSEYARLHEGAAEKDVKADRWARCPD
ncbi:MAG TPA: hybrid sensor histidine kinase/response regulator [bacterium]|nr:hybrid sensor histidine kinase/response regulator [bacterium]